MPAASSAQRLRFLATEDDRDLPIIDAHHHFFDLDHNYHPWLADRRLSAFRYGDYGAICRNFLPDDYRAGTVTHRVVGSVLMEGEWDPSDPVGEMVWADGVAERSGLADALIGQIWLDRDDLTDVLSAYTLIDRVRSVRHKPTAVARDAHRPDFSAPGAMRDRRWRDGFARLGAAGLHFDLQTPWWHLNEAAELARDFPQTLIILNHAGLPSDRSAEGLRAWRMALAHFAEEPNTRLKISGIGVPGQAWALDLQRPVIDAALAVFGVSRCAFASNFPVDGLCASFTTIFDVFKAATRHQTPQGRLALFHDNAAEWYGLTPAGHDTSLMQGEPSCA
jgi:predicted TIM-barrel fold metal-dependent hydrolase